MSARVGLALGGVVGLVLLGFAAVWLAGAVFFSMSGANPLGRTGLGTWWAYWQGYGSDRTVAPRLVLSALYGALIAFAPLVGIGVVVSKLRPRRSLHGDARFATKAEVRKAGLL